MSSRNIRRDSFYAEPARDARPRRSRRVAELQAELCDKGNSALLESPRNSPRVSQSASWGAMPENARWGTLIYVVRRSGCPMCRSQALLISHCRPILRKLGYRMVAILNCENSDNATFAKKYWIGETLCDTTRSFHQIIGGGTTLRARLPSDVLSPSFSARLARAVATQRVMPGFSLKGSGPLLGGTLLLRPGEEGIAYLQREVSLGDFGDLSSVIRAAHLHSPNRDAIDSLEVEAAIHEHTRRAQSSLMKLHKLTLPL